YNPLAWDISQKTVYEEKWIEVDDLPGAGKGVVFKEGNQEKSFVFEFNTNSWYHQNEWDHFWGKASPGSGIYEIDVQAELFSKDGSFSLDVTPINAWVSEGSSEVTEKGIFRLEHSGEEDIAHDGTLVTGGNSVDKTYGTRCLTVVLELEAPIAYSRLTNRFVPWVDFINAKTPESERTKDFSVYLTGINQGLGFPGKIFFEDPDAKPSEPYDKDMASSLQGKSWNDLITDLNSKAGQANLLGYKDSLASSVGYDSYLSDEYMEFIPITAPEGGAFEYSNDSPMVKASTNLVYSYNGNPPPPFDFSWPLDDAEILIFNQQQTAKKDELTKNPQKYTGTNADGTWWQLNDEEINQRRVDSNDTKTSSGQTTFDNMAGQSLWESEESSGQILPVPDYVNDVNYSATSHTGGIDVYLSSSGKNGFVKAQDLEMGEDWTTADDANLLFSDGKIQSDWLNFNSEDFSSRREIKISDHYNIAEDYQSANALKYTFLKQDPFGKSFNSPIDNPNLSFDGWEVDIKSKTGEENKDIVLEDVIPTSFSDDQAHLRDDKIRLKLNLAASESRFVEICGQTPDAYELMCFDGENWETIFEANEGAKGRLAWWDVSRLNGQYTVLLKSQGMIATTDVYIGTLIEKEKEASAWSTYKRAQLRFPAGAFVNGVGVVQDQLVTITPVSMKEINIRNRPIILTSGPIVEIKPSPWEFPIEPVDKRPTLRFVYTFEELADPLLGLWNVADPLPEQGANLGLQMNIHQVTSAGDLQVVSGNQQEIEINNGEHQYVFYAPLDHFSTYALLKGKFQLSAPIVYASRYITNQDSVTIYGTAEPDSQLDVYVFGEIRASFEGEEPKASTTAIGETGDYEFADVVLLQEGNNYIYVVSHLKDSPEIMTYSDVIVEKDTVPPVIKVDQNFYAFSPNNDGKYDSMDYEVKSDERGLIYFSAMGSNSGSVGQLINEGISAEANREYKIGWEEKSLRIYEPEAGASWQLVEERDLSLTYKDGEYIVSIYAIDEAGNISESNTSKVRVDTQAPDLTTLTASPNPFTPNDDGVEDTTIFSYELEEPAYVSLNIYTEDGELFRKHEAASSNFIYPTVAVTWPAGTSIGTWEWDGYGSRNEMLGGEYTYNVVAEDWVGNVLSSESQTIVVDRAPSLVPFAFAEPDPFSPVNPNNNFTEIKYYLARDGVQVNIAIVGEGSSTIKALVHNEIQVYGEQSVKWYGDFNEGYEGPRAVADQNRVGDGSYQFRIMVEDPAGGEPANVTSTVLVDNTPPYIVTKPIQVDYVTRIATLEYNVPEKATVEVSVYDVEGSLLAVLISGEGITGGDYVLEYDFSDNWDQNIERYFRIEAQDNAKNIAEKTTETFSVSPDLFRILNLAASPSTFTPNGDGHTDLTLISYNISGGEPDYTVSINILNPTQSTVNHLIENETQTSGIYSFYWDGKNDGDTYVEDGEYGVEVLAQDKLGTRIPSTSLGASEGRVTILAVSTRPTITLSLSSNIFSPDNDGVKDEITATYSIDYPVQYVTGEALLRLEVLNASAEAVWTKDFSHTAGTYSYKYDGLTADGLQLTAGDYYFQISAEDALSTTALPQTVSFQVDYESPSVGILYLEPALFSPNPNGRRDQTVLSYSLSKPAYVSVNVKSGDEVIRHLIVSEYKDAYVPFAVFDVSTFSVPTEVWDGTDNAGQIVADGIYEIVVVATDEAGNGGSVSSNVEVDNTQPEAPQVDSLVEHTNQILRTVSGVTEPSAEVEVLVTGDLSLVTFEGTADGFGNFSVPIALDLGDNLISSRVIDVAGNESGHTSSQALHYEITLPEIINLSVFPNPAALGSLLITFEVSEALSQTPEVYVNENPAIFESLAETIYTYLYNISEDDIQGDLEISINISDLASNRTEALFSNDGSLSFTIDTIYPVISEVEILPTLSSTGEVSIIFVVSETLEANPLVEINDNVAQWSGGPVVLQSGAQEYVYAYNVSAIDQQGAALLYIEASDLAHNLSTYQSNNLLTIDTMAPVFSNVDIDVTQNPKGQDQIVAYAKLGDELYVDFSVSEELRDDPVVDVGNYSASIDDVTVYSEERIDYSYLYTIMPDAPDGITIITIEAYDWAGNASLYQSGNFVIDKVSPGVNILLVNPNPASVEQVTITFAVSEGLKEVPIVRVTQSGADAGLAAVAGDWDIENGECEARYNLVAGFDGLAAINITVTDLASNVATFEYTDLLDVDTLPPQFSNLRCETSSFRDGIYYAKDGTEVDIYFDTSEGLQFNPTVTVNEDSASYDELVGDEYHYKYTIEASRISEDDYNQYARLSISGFDFAENEGAEEVSSATFVIDITTPEVEEYMQGTSEVIAVPYHFATNADPDGSIPLFTVLHYQLSEDSLVTLSIHKIEHQPGVDYVKEDFNDGNKVITLINGQWQQGNIEQHVNWDGNISGDQYAEPGKYAFIVTAQDAAGNITEIKYGGTFWIQDNVLKLVPPDQLLENNPDPSVISPFGNSPEGSDFKRARLYFRINLGITPFSVWPSEWIRAMNPDDINWDEYKDLPKKVGTYQLKVYDESDNLIWESSIGEAYSARDHHEDWEGIDDAGNQVADGRYKMMVEVLDFRGQPLYADDLGEKWVTVDNTKPAVNNLSAAPYCFSPGATESTIKTTTVTYEVSDNSGSSKVTIDVFSEDSFVNTLLADEEKDNGRYSEVWDGTSGSGYVGDANNGEFPDGVYSFALSCVDEAGNSSDISSLGVYVDTQGPNTPDLSSIIHNDGDYAPEGPDEWSRHNSPYLFWDDPGDNGGAGTSRYEYMVDGGTWADLGSQSYLHVLLGDGEGHTVNVSAVDALGNTGTSGQLVFDIDTEDPYFSSGPAISETPVDAWSNHNSPYITFTAADLTSGVAEVKGYIGAIDQGTVTSPWEPTLSDGHHSISLEIIDNAGNIDSSSTYNFYIDTTDPNAPSLTVDHTSVSPTYSNHDSPYFTWSDPGDNGGSGISCYEGYIDGVSQGNVSSGWHPTLSDGSHAIYVRAVDGMGYYANSSSYYFDIDTQDPYISQPADDTDFNPYLEDETTINFTVYDNGASGIGAATARIKYGDATIKDLTVYGGDQNRYISWDGINDSGDYVNEGDYTLEINATDNAENSAEPRLSAISLRDDQYIAAAASDSYITWDGDLYLRWIDGYTDSEEEIEVGAVSYGGGSGTLESFSIGHEQTIVFDITAGYDPSYGGVAWTFNGEAQAIQDTTKTLSAGTHEVRVWAFTTNHNAPSAITVSADYVARKCNQYEQVSSDGGRTWTHRGGWPDLLDTFQTGASEVTVNGVAHTTWASGGEIYYRRDHSSDIRIASPGVDQTLHSPCIAADQDGTAYVAWLLSSPMHFNVSYLYFQKIPENFAPVNGSQSAAIIGAVDEQTVTTQSTTFEAPTLVTPLDEADVTSLRPTFTWDHHKLDATEYEIDLAKNDSFSIDLQTFSKTADTGSPDQDDTTLYHYTYQIHEFDPGLDRDTYYWKVTAVATNESATSEVWSFSVAPDLTLTDITNYPNPFNSNREKTQIRYRLGTDVDSVTIRIYDLTGALVKQISNCPTDGEGASIWAKYCDVEWSGKNGKGDVVVNGIYPFEVIARLGDRSVSGRGKVAVLK
ncbi:MAG: Ig-like domain repeat protein, partial [Candidatus Saganbacteria bacterium]|nr:Ig-like domain repeat protein [Candidatus Saganbacteria bacterium]